jgi:hypothetical protein
MDALDTVDLNGIKAVSRFQLRKQQRDGDPFR